VCHNEYLNEHYVCGCFIVSSYNIFCNSRDVEWRKRAVYVGKNTSNFATKIELPIDLRSRNSFSLCETRRFRRRSRARDEEE